MSSETVINEEIPIELGYAEETDAFQLVNIHLPNKIGGKPAWLELDGIPSTEELKCNKCGGPQSFLCQIYAPCVPSDLRPDCYHRMLYVFVCREAGCFSPNNADNFVAFRSQLPLQNKFFPLTQPPDDEELPPIEPSCKICTVCGCRGQFMCSRCNNTNYCSAEHQRAHWPQHKIVCQSEKSETKEVNVHKVTFPEFEIVMEKEELNSKCSDESDVSDDDSDEKRRLEDFQKLVDQKETGSMSYISDTELQKYTVVDDDECFRKFKERISANPEQILRYADKGDPLWIADVNKTVGNFKVPPCELCNSPRHYEFQIMPQLLNYLKDDNIDWGLLVVYTCNNLCKLEGRYAREFIIKQDIVSDNK